MSQQVIYPQTKEEAGPHYWATLFNTASRYPVHPSDEERSDINNYIKSTIKNFVCDDCIENSFDYIRSNPIKNSNREELLKYLCGLKNNSNKHEGKDEVDCSNFVMTSINNEKAACKSCSIEEKVAAPVTKIPAKPKVEAPQQQPVYASPYTYNSGMAYTYGNMANILNNYPNIKRALNINDAGAYQTQQSQAFLSQSDVSQQLAVAPNVVMAANPTQLNQLAQKYPTLAGIDMSLDGQVQQEELVGILKALDPIYQFPAQIVGIPASQMNLAYTPEMLSNSMSLITQIYLTNAGSMLTSVLSSTLLIAVSIFMKNSIASYDRLFIQNVAGSLLFHTLNFLNPRAKDDLIPDLQKLFEGITKGNFDVMKEALLFKNKEEGNVADKSAQQLLNMIKSKKGIIDMKKLSENHMDLRAGHAFNSTGGTLTREEYDSMVDNGHEDPDVNFGSIGDTSSEFDYMLDTI